MKSLEIHKVCDSCLAWENSASQHGEINVRKGQCRINPPSVSGWPKTSDKDWCLAWTKDTRTKPINVKRKESEPAPIGFDYTFVRDFPELADVWLKAARANPDDIPEILQPLIENPLSNLMTPLFRENDKISDDLLLWAEALPGSGTPEELDDIGYRSILTIFEIECIEENKKALASLPNEHPWNIAKVGSHRVTRKSKKND